MFDNSKDIELLRKPKRRRRFLIVIRAGSGERPSLFRNPLPRDRNFDIAMNYFAPPHADDAMQRDAEFVVAGGLSKYHAAKRMMHAGLFHAYDGVYFLDDDIELHFDPSEFLAYCADRRFAIAQASLTHASDGAWRITFHHSAWEYRLTNFVEVMAPYFSNEFLMNAVEGFDRSISTYGLDVLWASLLADDQAAAIIDRFQMSHLRRRDFTGAYYAYLESIGVNPFVEMKNILTMLGIESYEIRLMGGAQVVESVRVDYASKP